MIEKFTFDNLLTMATIQPIQEPIVDNNLVNYSTSQTGTANTQFIPKTEHEQSWPALLNNHILIEYHLDVTVSPDNIEKP